MRGSGMWTDRGDGQSSHIGMKHRVWHRGENRNWFIQGLSLKHVNEFGAYADGSGKLCKSE